MHVLAGLALACFIAGCGAWGVREVMSGVAARVPERTRQQARSAGRKVTKSAVEPVRHIKARAMADVRATDWLERKRAGRARRESRPPRRETAIRATKAVGRGMAETARVPAAVARRVPKLGAAISKAGVTDKQQAPAQPAAQRPAPAAAATDMKPSAPATTTKAVPAVTERPATMPAQTRPSITPDHAALNARVANYEPENDGDLIRWMTGEVAGIHGYAQALEQVSEHLVNSLGLDPAAVQGITEYAQAMTEAAALMARANARFQQVYQGVRETVANGTVLPHQGRWITGESA